MSVNSFRADAFIRYMPCSTVTTTKLQTDVPSKPQILISLGYFLLVYACCLTCCHRLSRNCSNDHTLCLEVAACSNVHARGAAALGAERGCHKGPAVHIAVLYLLEHFHQQMVWFGFVKRQSPLDHLFAWAADIESTLEDH